MSVSGVVLAAGLSRRLKRPKQLLPLDGKPLIRVTTERALASRLAEVIVVTGGYADEVAAALSDVPVRIVFNPDFAEGQSTSLRAGLAAVDAACAGVLFLLGDQPEITPDMIDALIVRFEMGDADIVQPVYGGVPGNPVLFGRGMFPGLARVEGDQGARSLMTEHRDKIVRVTVSDGPPPGDVDSEADYRALVARWDSGGTARDS